MSAAAIMSAEPDIEAAVTGSVILLIIAVVIVSLLVGWN